MKTITFVDAGVLIAAARGSNKAAERAMQILDDPEREFAASAFVELEVLPKSLYYKRANEAAFYQAFFASVTHWVADPAAIVTDARNQASAYGLAALDALHVAAAKRARSAELVTTEKPTSPLFRVEDPRVVSIQPEPPAP